VAEYDQQERSSPVGVHGAHTSRGTAWGRAGAHRLDLIAHDPIVRLRRLLRRGPIDRFGVPESKGVSARRVAADHGRRRRPTVQCARPRRRTITLILTHGLLLTDLRPVLRRFAAALLVRRIRGLGRILSPGPPVAG